MFFAEIVGDSEGPLQVIYAPKAPFGVLATNALAGTCTPILFRSGFISITRKSLGRARTQTDRS